MWNGSIVIKSSENKIWIKIVVLKQCRGLSSIFNMTINVRMQSSIRKMRIENCFSRSLSALYIVDFMD